jgi:hypothetical protein
LPAQLSRYDKDRGISSCGERGSTARTGRGYGTNSRRKKRRWLVVVAVTALLFLLPSTAVVRFPTGRLRARKASGITYH